MPYSPTTFVDVPDPNNPPPGAVPINAAELNKIGTGIQTAQATAESAQADADAIESGRGQPNGYASLDASGDVPVAQLPGGVLAGSAPAYTIPAHTADRALTAITWTLANYNVDRTLDAADATTTLNELADVVATLAADYVELREAFLTLLADLVARGVIASA